MTNAIIDYLSITWTPEELGQVIDLAKMGASIKAVRGNEYALYGQLAQERYNVTENMAVDMAAIDYVAAFQAKFKTTMFEVGTSTARNKFHEVKHDLFNHFGLNTLDCICRGEVDRFINRLNHGLGLFGNVWSYSMCSGGLFGYPHSADILVNGQQAGKCAWGANNHGCYVSISGVGTTALDMQAVYDALNELPGAKITRVDIAHDSLDGKYDIKTARKMAEQGLFVNRGRPCSYSYIESGHMFKHGSYIKESWRGKEPTEESLKKRYGFCPDKGKSFYVGSRESGKLLRTYEKGKQLQSKQHPDWVRWELELRNKNRSIPFEVLLEPAKYLAGAYPALEFVNEEQCSIATHKRTYMTSVENAVKNGATQCGKLVNYMRHCLGLTAEQVVKQLTGHLESHEIPDRLNTIVFGDTEESEGIKLSEMMVLKRRNHHDEIYQRLTMA
ncbi:replication initiation factor domain-containing protein [Photobacterium sp. J15]|uniref:replication initiation factor domain-containing protein n=1 Tax=Photobacterium sp. J15 TaxID=265901 RepID=UPI0007E35970|nr:replication initiation factor domain-containing protein [Photobacterium sp. J15]